ncbi:uncharacterized protein LOC133310922 [Gastrolobium bilobum]|uniref:uncharacterized protein LOC133310922 n=1 Tax=Gastrolobium bilobum TaxID=150636 RepID=UPI002AAFF8C9|nr:uncharacterized protein LOC133310922 [Gastrolobium bilobum]
MRSKGHSQSMFLRIVASPIRFLSKARDMYVKSITNCGQNMSYGNPMDDAGRFSTLSRSHSAATSRRSEVNEDFAELVRAASARTLVNRIDMDLVLKEQQHVLSNFDSKRLPKSTSVGMARIDEEDMPSDLSEGGVAFVPGSYPRSKSYAVGKGNVVF